MSAQAANAKLARIGISSRSFDAIVKMGNGAPNPAARTVDFLDLAHMVADKLGVHHLELQHAHFFSTEPAYLKDLKDRVTTAKSQIAQITTQFFQSNASSNGPSLRQSVDLAKQWIDHAVALGCPRVVVNAGTLAENVRATAINSLKDIDVYAKAHRVAVAIMNMDNGMAPAAPPPPEAPAAPAAPRQGEAGRADATSGTRRGGAAAAPARGAGGGRGNAPARPATWQLISEVARAAGIAVAPSFLGFPSEAERIAGLKVLIPMSNGTCQVAMAPGKIDLADGVKTCQDAGYSGLYTVVADGTGDPWAATKTAVDELVKLI